jgi:replicative DNA helicase
MEGDHSMSVRSRDVTSGHVANGALSTPVAALMTAIRAAEGEPNRPATPSGFPILDGVLEGGFKSRDLVLVGGAPGVGKTVATLQWARNIASTGQPVTYVSFEHDERSLFGRLLLMELGELPARRRGPGLAELRPIVNAVARGEAVMSEGAANDVRLKTAWGRVEAYADELTLVRGSATTGVDEIMSLAEGDGTTSPVLFVDYLQKVPMLEAVWDDDVRAARLGEALKDVAMSSETTVVAVTAGNRAALTGRRLRLEHLRGSAGLAYEADVVLMLNEKLLSVSKAHTAFNGTLVDEFRTRVIFTVEKNRDGPAPVDIEFRKEFATFRFDPDGSHVAERLIDDRMVME